MTPSADAQAFRRMLTAGVLTRFGLVTLALAGTAMYVFPFGNPTWGAMLFALTSLLYFYLAWRSVVVSRDAMPAHEFMARGDLPEAERILTSAIRAFSLFPGQRQMELLQLSQLRFAQHRYMESAELSGTVLSLRTAWPVGMQARLMRLEALIELADWTRAYAVLMEVSAAGGPATAGTPSPGPRTGGLNALDSARLLACQTRYESAIGAHDHVLYGLPEKVKLAALLPSAGYARWCVEVARSARAKGRSDLADHLIGRAVALVGGQEVSRVAGDLADACLEEAGLRWGGEGVESAVARQ